MSATELDGVPELDWTLGDAKNWTRELVEDGVHCPLCEQYAKVYRRKINGAMVLALAALYRAGGADDYVHTPDFLNAVPGNIGGGDLAKLRYWRLVVELDEPRDDGGRAGYWKITPDGVEFLRGRLRVPKYVRLYDGRRLGFVRDELVDISDCYGQPFRLDDLMAGI